MSRIIPLFILSVIYNICCIPASVIQPTVSNVTGDYYTSTQSLSYGIINCNSSRNCYISCSLTRSCSLLQITCSSPLCSLSCSGKSACQDAEFAVTSVFESTTNPNGTDVILECSAENSCKGLNFTAKGDYPPSGRITATFEGSQALTGSTLDFQNIKHIDLNLLNCQLCGWNTYNFYGIDRTNVKATILSDDVDYPFDTFTFIDSLNINMTCIGIGVCRNYIINTTTTGENIEFDGNNFNIDCHDKESCKAMEIYQSPSDQLVLDCSDGYGICENMKLLVSPYYYHTNVLCNGTANSAACNNVIISVPADHHQGFLYVTFPNDQNDNLPYAGSIDGVRIQCIDGTSDLCNDYAPFPLIFGNAIPENTTKDTLIYNGTYDYQYYFKNISCLSGQECFVYCQGDRTCGNALIECQSGSSCHVYCDEADNCDNIVIVAYGDSVELRCSQTDSCRNVSIWLPETEFSGDFLDISSCSNGDDRCQDTEFICGDYEEFEAYIYENNDECVNSECCPFVSFTTTTKEPSTGSSNSGLSAGGAVGIVFGIIIVIVAVVVIIFFVRKRKMQQHQAGAYSEMLVDQ